MEPFLRTVHNGQVRGPYRERRATLGGACSNPTVNLSTCFFLLAPVHDATSEILHRTAPTIYDALIALFGGLAGMLATSSKLKGNVIPGVAIATALMPPLCTARRHH
jgi:uncharacterized membrane protein